MVREKGWLVIVSGASLLGILAPTTTRLLKSWLTPAPGRITSVLDTAVALPPRLVMLCGLELLYQLAPSRRTGFSEVWVAALVVMLLLWMLESFFVA